MLPLGPPDRTLREGHIVTTEDALFPGYRFIHLDLIDDNWSIIRSTRRVNQVVRFDDCPLPVSDEIITQIRTRLTNSRFAEPYLRPGERIRITEGRFAQPHGFERVVRP